MWQYVIFLFTLLTFFTGVAQAAFSFEIDSVFPEKITSKEEEVLVKLKIKDLPSESYFRVSFQKNDKARYFGFMKNDRDEWVEAGTLNIADCNKFYYVSDLTTENLEIYLKLGKDDIEPGVYNIKAHRYTSSCGSSPKISGNSAQVEIFVPTHPPSPTLGPTPSLTPKPSFSPTLFPSPAATFTRTQKPSALSSPGPSSTPMALEFSENNLTPTPTSTPDYFADTQATPTVLGLSDGNDVNNLQKKKTPFVAVAMIASGAGLLGFGIISLLYKLNENADK